MLAGIILSIIEITVQLSNIFSPTLQTNTCTVPENMKIKIIINNQLLNTGIQLYSVQFSTVYYYKNH